MRNFNPNLKRSQVFFARRALNKEEQDGTMSLMSSSMFSPFGYQQVDRQILCDLRQQKTSVRTFNILFEMVIALIC